MGPDLGQSMDSLLGWPLAQGQAKIDQITKGDPAAPAGGSEGLTALAVTRETRRRRHLERWPLSLQTKFRR
jgi:hypothetical protein